jgi:hypothetical protein
MQSSAISRTAGTFLTIGILVSNGEPISNTEPFQQCFVRFHKLQVVRSVRIAGSISTPRTISKTSSGVRSPGSSAPYPRVLLPPRSINSTRSGVSLLVS